MISSNINTVLGKTLVVSVLLLLFLSSRSQEGNAFLTSYYFPSDLGQFSIYDIEQLSDGNLALATSKGLIIFNGNDWQSIPLKNVPIQLEPSKFSPEFIYMATTKNIGYLQKNQKGEYSYQIIQECENQENIWDIVQLGDTIAFASSSSVFVFSEKESMKLIHEKKTNSNNAILGLIATSRSIYTHTLLEGVTNLEGSLKINSSLGELEILFSHNQRSQTIFCTDNNQTWIFDDNQIKELKIEAQDYISESTVSCGVGIADGIFAVGTLTGGCVIIDSKTGKTNTVVNYQTGLPDDEVFALTTDKNGGLWVAHEFGLTRVNLHFPISNFSSYPGLEGNLLSVYANEKDLYVATSEGVFYLDEVRDYKEIEVLVKQKVEHAVPIETNYVSPILQIEEREIKLEEAEEEKLTLKQKLKQKIRKRKDRKKGEPEEELAVEDSARVVDNEFQPQDFEAEKPSLPINKERKQEQTTTSKEKIYALQSIKYFFKRVDGIEDKCKELISVNNDIIVAGNKGVYVISNKKSSTLLNGKYINKLFGSRYAARVYIGTEQGIASIVEENNKWRLESTYSEFAFPVVSIVEVDHHHLWLGSRNLAFQLNFNDQQDLIETQTHQFATDATEEVYVREIYGKPFFFLRSGIYGYDEAKDSLYYNIEVNERFFNRYRYVFSQNTITWVQSNGEWININHEPELLSLKSFYLNLFDNVQNIFVDEEQNLWVIDGSYKLYFIEASAIPNSEQKFDVFFVKVRNGNGSQFGLSNLKFEYDNSALTFNLSAPYYVKSSRTQYQYTIEGLMKTWSEWSDNPNISFPFIPEGKYTIKVKARNVFGVESEEKSIEFVVLPPFWRTGWFYFIVFILSIAVIVLVIKWRERNLKREQHILEEKVKIRTHQLDLEKKKSDELLHNILPHETAQELKSKGKATARYYNLTTVLFTDFKGFTKISESITPVELVKELDECFIAFDDIIGKHNIEKIKTIGDAYMCAGGVPSRNQSNPIEAVLAGLEITGFMERLKQNRMEEGKPYWELRLGIHTGPLIAGVVGKKKFAYDVWGDTVNTASRMESSGEPGRINISAKTHELVKNYFVCESRGKVAAKNKGELEMFFVERIKPEYSSDKEGRIPNEKLKQVVEELR